MGKSHPKGESPEPEIQGLKSKIPNPKPYHPPPPPPPPPPPEEPPPPELDPGAVDEEEMALENDPPSEEAKPAAPRALQVVPEYHAGE